VSQVLVATPQLDQPRAKCVGSGARLDRPRALVSVAAAPRLNPGGGQGAGGPLAELAGHHGSSLSSSSSTNEQRNNRKKQRLAAALAITGLFQRRGSGSGRGGAARLASGGGDGGRPSRP
jgi:hypothetical protein